MAGVIGAVACLALGWKAVAPYFLALPLGRGLMLLVERWRLRGRGTASHNRTDAGDFWDFNGVRIGLVGHSMRVTHSHAAAGATVFSVHEVEDVVVRPGRVLVIRAFDGSETRLGVSWASDQSVAFALDHLRAALARVRRGTLEDRLELHAALAPMRQRADAVDPGAATWRSGTRGRRRDEHEI